MLYAMVRAMGFLPLWILYLFANLTAWFLEHVFKYRKNVIEQNLSVAFPKASPDQRLSIKKAYYQYLADLLVEFIKLASIPQKELLKRMQIEEKTLHLANELKKTYRKFICVLGHCGNWEWAGPAFAAQHILEVLVIYHKLKHPIAEQLVKKIRSRFGPKLVDMAHTAKVLLGTKTPYAAMLVADQNVPSENAFWTIFLNRETNFFRGPAVLAQKLQAPVVYVNISCIKRGYYRIEAECISRPEDNLDQEVILHRYVKKLEASIYNAPPYWLWSHRRWKYSRPENSTLYL